MEADMSLHFIDHRETKESFPERQKVHSPDKKKIFVMEEVKNDMNGNPDVIKNKQDTEVEKDESEVLLEELRRSDSTIGKENKVHISQALEDSGFEEKESRPEVEPISGKSCEDRNVTTLSEHKENTKKSDSLYEFTSASSMFLSNEKVNKGAETSTKEKKDDVVSESSELVQSPLSLQSEMIKQSLQKNQFSSPDQKHSSPGLDDSSVSIEEDEEKVIIHLDSKLNESVSGSCEVPPLCPVEVERKFKVTADTKIKLVEIGAELHKEKVFFDKYYDNPDYALTLKDCWLRQRNGSWELKVVNGRLTKFSTQYQEITNYNEIVDFLVNHFRREDLGDAPIDQVIQKLDLVPFVEFTTTRQTYFLPECTIDLDLTGFGYQVGEIEVMASDKSQIPRALDTITSVAEKLGFETFQM
ncbi:uncharacterized protein LOC133205500 [Saccostrea echinata]|uniref:uncharacterized protein LOC133205500 n=1 Tax=Saccostrea echinata TaxID=191078 RepID=UPI002A81BB2A|nr:uncharacterized protein LOC133205500 [Saccostrea echinata]